MKKYFYLAAVSAMMLTACSSDNDVVQPTPAQPTQPVAVQQQAVGFDVYVPAATAGTRAGTEGVMTTTTLQTSGFGVFAQYSNGSSTTDGAYTTTVSPSNFMWNQLVSWSSSAWSYTPLKYWPNETDNDSQSPAATSTHADKLSFFAYAPYVRELSTNYDGKLDIAGDNTTDKYSASPTKADSKIANTADEGGIEAVIANNATGNDPWVRYQVATDPSKSVDLLWGVAPSGGLSYNDVTGNTTTVTAGMPLIDLIKPAKDERMKFLFKHALARIGMTIVAAIDQISAGGNLSATTKIVVKSVQIDEVTAAKVLNMKGALNLNNTNPGEALWQEKTGMVTGLKVAFDDSPSLLNPAIAYKTNDATSYTTGTITGVTATEVPVIKASDGKLHYFMVIPGHANTDLQVTIDYVVITEDAKLAGGYSVVENVIKKTVTIPTLTNNKAYNLKLILGLTSVKLDAEVADWEIMGSTPVDLPQNTAD